MKHILILKQKGLVIVIYQQGNLYLVTTNKQTIDFNPENAGVFDSVGKAIAYLFAQYDLKTLLQFHLQQFHYTAIKYLIAHQRNNDCHLSWYELNQFFELPEHDVEVSFSRHLMTILDSDWTQLFSFIPVFEKARKTDTWIIEVDDEDLENYNGYAMYVIHEFFSHVDKSRLLVIYNWNKNVFGHQSYEDENFNFNELSFLALLKLLTFHVRAEHYNYGHFETCVKKGVIEKLLLSLKTKVNDSKKLN